MKTNEFNQITKAVKNGDLKGLTGKTISEMTIPQAQKLEDLMLDLKLNKEGNQILDILCTFIGSQTKAEKAVDKVANKKAPTKEAPKAPEKAPEAPKEAPKAEDKLKAPKKEEKSTSTKLKGNSNKEEKLSQTLKVGDKLKFRVEGEEIEHNITIVNIGKYHIIAIMTEDEKEVFNIKKADLDKQVFGWKDRHNETYNIIVTL